MSSAAARTATLTRVTGGGVVALPYADVLALAGGLDRAGERVRDRAGHAGAVAVSPFLLASAPFSPLTAEAAGAAVGALAAALAVWSEAIGVDARAVRTAVGLLTAADAAVHARLRALELGIAAGYGRERVPPRVVATPLRPAGSALPPTGLPSLVDHLQEVGALSADGHPEGRGSIEVQTVTAADGARRHVVYLPGLDDTRPLSGDGDVRDVGSAAHLVAGLPTAYGAGVLEAMRRAGVRPGEPVLLVGHSQGGMQAVQLAVHGTPYDITDVVTLGSPAVPGDLPPGVDVLSLEHLGDAVPLLDGGSEVPSDHHVTVTFDSGIAGSLHGDHDLGNYQAGALAAERSPDPVVRHAVERLRPFLARPGDRATATVFRITRGASAPDSPRQQPLTGCRGRTR